MSALPTFDQETDAQQYREFQRENPPARRKSDRPRTSWLVQIGEAVTHWPELVERSLRHPDGAVELFDLRDSVDAVLGPETDTERPAGRVMNARDYAERHIMSGDECQPPRVTVCSIETHQEYEVYQGAGELRLEARALAMRAQLTGKWTSSKTLTDAAQLVGDQVRAVRLFQDIRRHRNGTPVVRARKPHLTTARHGGTCALCSRDISIGTPIHVLNGTATHVEC